MARDTLSITGGGIDPLKRLGVAVPAAAAELTPGDYFAFWREAAPRDHRPHLGLPIRAPGFGRSTSSQPPERALGTPLVTANRAAYERLVPGLEARLAGKRSLVGDVRIAIGRTISAGARPSVDTVAHRLETSPRTLQRRLGSARTTFQDQLEDVRHVVARRLLEHTELEPIDIAFLLGFTEPNSFVRAFRSWERTTPLRWRAART